jgi:hypothetical protein
MVDASDASGMENSLGAIDVHSALCRQEVSQQQNSSCEDARNGCGRDLCPAASLQRSATRQFNQIGSDYRSQHLTNRANPRPGCFAAAFCG